MNKRITTRIDYELFRLSDAIALKANSLKIILTSFVILIVIIFLKAQENVLISLTDHTQFSVNNDILSTNKLNSIHNSYTRFNDAETFQQEILITSEIYANSVTITQLDDVTFHSEYSNILECQVSFHGSFQNLIKLLNKFEIHSNGLWIQSMKFSSSNKINSRSLVLVINGILI